MRLSAPLGVSFDDYFFRRVILSGLTIQYLPSNLKVIGRKPRPGESKNALVTLVTSLRHDVIFC